MGLLKKLFGDSRETPVTVSVCEKNTVYAPVSGRVIALKEIGDGVFSEGILGPGCAICPESEMITAPFDGKVVQVAGTKHAVGIESSDGLEVLIHVGIDTVAMNGKGFTVHVECGDMVRCGQKLMTFSKKAVSQAGYPDTVVVLVTNSDHYQEIQVCAEGETAAAAKLLYAME